MPLVLHVSVLSRDFRRRMRQIALLLMKAALAELEYARPFHVAVPRIGSPSQR